MWYSAVRCLVMLALSMLIAPCLAVAQPAGQGPKIGMLMTRSATQVGF